VYPAGQRPALGMDIKRPFLSDSILFCPKNLKVGGYSPKKVL